MGATTQRGPWSGSWPSWTTRAATGREGSADGGSSSRAGRVRRRRCSCSAATCCRWSADGRDRQDDDPARRSTKRGGHAQAAQRREGRFEDGRGRGARGGAQIRDDARADATRIREELQEQADREVERIRQRGAGAARRRSATRRSAGCAPSSAAQSMELAERVVGRARWPTTAPQRAPSTGSWPSWSGRAAGPTRSSARRRPAEGRADGDPAAVRQPGVAGGGRAAGSTRTIDGRRAPTSAGSATTCSPCSRLLTGRDRAAPAPGRPGGPAGGASAARRPAVRTARSAAPALDVALRRWSSARWSRAGRPGRRRWSRWPAGRARGGREGRQPRRRRGRAVPVRPHPRPRAASWARCSPTRGAPPTSGSALLREVLGGRVTPGHRDAARAGRAHAPRPQPGPGGRGAVRAGRGPPRPLRRARPHRRCGCRREQEQRLTESLTPALRPADLAAGRARPVAARRPGRPGRRRADRRQRGRPARRRPPHPARLSRSNDLSGIPLHADPQRYDD